MNVVYVESTGDLEILKKSIHKEDVFLYAISESTDKHPAVDSACLLFIKPLFKDNIFAIPINHADGICEIDIDSVIDDINIFTKRRFVLDKKSFCHLLGICDTLDVNILSYVVSQEIIDDSINVTAAHNFYNHRFPNCNSINRIIPINKHLEKFKILYEYVEDLVSKHDPILKLESFTHLNDDIIVSLAEIESVGLKVNCDKFISSFGAEHKSLIQNGFVYSQYNIFTSTGRPSNAFGGVNYAALNKEDKSREAFISRFGNDGKLVDIDFVAFHPHLIANLINYQLSLNTNVYEYLGQYYFNSKSISTRQIKEAKGITFRQLYGGVEFKYKKIPYFRKWNDYISQRYQFFKENGYVETPKFNRRMKFSESVDVNKMGSYILQAYETEVGLSTTNSIIKYLSSKHSKIVLYTYDSILIDFYKEDGKETLLEIKKIMMNNDKFPVKINIGDNYNYLKEIGI